MPLTPRPQHSIDERLDRELAQAFAPMHKLAFGVAVGCALALVLFTVTAVRLVRVSAEPTELLLLAQFFAGYTESWNGAFVALAWGFSVGVVAGWFAAFVRNFVMATWFFTMRARAELDATRDFLDHI